MKIFWADRMVADVCGRSTDGVRVKSGLSGMVKDQTKESYRELFQSWVIVKGGEVRKGRRKKPPCSYRARKLANTVVAMSKKIGLDDGKSWKGWRERRRRWVVSEEGERGGGGRRCLLLQPTAMPLPLVFWQQTGALLHWSWTAAPMALMGMHSAPTAPAMVSRPRRESCFWAEAPWYCWMGRKRREE